MFSAKQMNCQCQTNDQGRRENLFQSDPKDSLFCLPMDSDGQPRDQKSDPCECHGRTKQKPHLHDLAPDECRPSQYSPEKKSARVTSMVPITTKGCCREVVFVATVDTLTILDGGPPEALLSRTGVGVAQLPGVTPGVGANCAARTS
jgi:hypothetical protein